MAGPTVFLRTALIISVCAFVTACGSRDGNASNVYGLTAEIRGDSPPERAWVEAEVDTVAALSSGEGYTLFKPGTVEFIPDGNIYVYDFGDFTIKAFTAQGEYVASYGNGRGRGPGQVIGLTDTGLWRDSLIYLVDSRLRRISFFAKDGDLVRTENYDHPVWRLDWTDDSIRIATSPSPAADFIVMEAEGRQISVSQLFMDNVPSLARAGLLHAGRKKAIYVPRYLPVLLTYSLDDTIGTAYPTPDYGAPRPETRDYQGGTLAPATEMNGRSTLQGGVLTVERPSSAAGDSVQFDLYDARQMTYMHSVRLPIEGKTSRYAYGMDRVVSIRDTTVHLYRVMHPAK